MTIAPCPLKGKSKKAVEGSRGRTAVLIVLFSIMSIGQTVLGQGTHQIHLMINPNPTVNFGTSVNPLYNPMIFNFSDSSSVNPGVITSWNWNFGDDSTSTLANPAHTYITPGYYDVRLTVGTQAGCDSSLTKTIFVKGVDSVSLIVDNAVQCEPGNSFAFTGGSVPAAYSYQWDFGDGSTSSLASPVHSYADSGTFTVRLIVSAPAPSVDMDTAYATVKVVPTPNVHSANNVYCSGEDVPAYYFTGDVPGAVYMWNRTLGQNIAIGLNQVSGVDSMPEFTAQNNGFRHITAIYHVKPYYTTDGLTCEGTGENFMITVNPVPQMANVPDRVYYNGQSVVAYTFTGNTPNANYSWRFLSGDTINGLAATGNNQMPAFTAVNNRIAPINARYEAVPVYAYAHKTCTGTTDTFDITIMPNGSVSLTDYIQVCGDESEVMLSCENNVPDITLYYKIIFSDKALEAGFDNINSLTLLADSIPVVIPSGIESEKYIGHLYIKSNYSSQYDIYDFVIDVMPTTRIIQQPESKVMICNSDSFILEVAAEGTNLNYQWYKDGLPIAGATQAFYEKANADSSDFGSYTVEVSGDCGTLMSSVSSVGPNSIFIMQKWNDVIFISNRDSAGNIQWIESYQWYRVYPDGSMMPIRDKGQSQYYSEKDIEGTFAVEVTFADGSKQMSCPYTIVQTQKAVVKVYPNPGKPNEKLNVFLDLAGNKVEGSIIEVFDELGKPVDKKIATGNTTEFYLNVPSAIYIFKITEPNGQVTTRKVVIQD